MEMILANKYRPTEFTDVCAQDVNIKILTKQLNEGRISHNLLFAGNAGCGKTTCAKILASKLKGEVYELDCASHNGVSDIKELVEIAKTKPLMYDYRVFILDECHTLSSQAWSSLLITLEENLPYAIFIFCTTNTEKIPSTIISRLKRFNFLPIDDANMRKRLALVCKTENLAIDDEAMTYIVKSAKGNLRQAITNIDMCRDYGDLTVENICKVLNIVSLDVLSDLFNYYVTKDTTKIIEIVENLYNNGYELHQFVAQFLDYCLYKDNLSLVERLLTINRDIKYDDNPKNIIIASLII